MAIVKLSSSKRSVQFIDENGNVFFTSVNYLVGLMNGSNRYGFVQLKRLPIPVSMHRYKPSELWDPDGLVNSKTLQGNSVGTDIQSPKGKKKLERVESTKDKIVW